MAMIDIKAKQPGLPRAGKIRLGRKTKNAKGVEYPVEADHFVLDDVPEVAAWAKEKLGTDRPRALPIFLPFDEIDLCIPGFHKLYLGSGLWCKGDGEKIVYSADTMSGKTNINDGVVQIPIQMKKTNEKGEPVNDTEFVYGETVPCPGTSENGRWHRCQFCKPQATIVFMLRGLPVEDLRLATYHIETRSINNYARLTERLAYFSEKYGYLQGIDFILVRVQEEIGIPNLDKKGNRKKGRNGGFQRPRTRAKKWLLDLEVDPAWIVKMMMDDTRLALPRRETPALPEVIELPTEQVGIGDDEPVIHPDDDREVTEAAANRMLLGFIMSKIPWFTDEALVHDVMDRENLSLNDPNLIVKLEAFAKTQADLAAQEEERRRQANIEEAAREEYGAAQGNMFADDGLPF